VPSDSRFPELPLPFELPYPPMEAKRTEKIPEGDGWQFEPKWDGFRALVFRHGEQLVIQSKSGQPLARYFPELVEAFLSLPVKSFVADGEIVIRSSGRLSFDDLLLRLHPAESRVQRLATEIPAEFYAFDLLYEGKRGGRGDDLSQLPIEKRRERLEAFIERIGPQARISLSPATLDRNAAQEWFEKFGSLGLDGLIAKKLGEPYHSGDRDGMLKIKHFKEADCVVGGFRYSEPSREIAVLLLGLYDRKGRLHHIGNASSFTAAERKRLKEKVEPLAGGEGFSGTTLGGPSRWSAGKVSKTSEPVPLEPSLVCEVSYDYYSQGRFRHGAKFLRWRPDKDPRSCTFDQIPGAKPRE
jgi:ATP-dependent DNA ligase